MSRLFYKIKEWQDFRCSSIFSHKTLGFVPTMGNLHTGHQSLLERSKKENDLTALSIFVNPTQFDNADDLKKYLRTVEKDVQIAQQAGVDFILMPEQSELYPDNYRYRVSENEFSQQLCGKYRPGHFDGVLTIVLKLFQLVQAKKAYFGEKDFQQLRLIQGMGQAFFLNTEIVACPTIRDKNGLALSSRNSRLSADQYELSLNFPRLLNSNLSCDQVVDALKQLGFVVDYVEEFDGRRFGAMKIGDVRLIDNIPIKKPSN